jgi:hypothetical protein
MAFEVTCVHLDAGMVAIQWIDSHRRVEETDYLLCDVTVDI